jgi:hypothetical protein
MEQTQNLPAQSMPQTVWGLLGIHEQTFNTALSPIAQGWLSLAANKVIVFDKLKRDELAIQSHLAGIEKLSNVSDATPDETVKNNLEVVQSSLERAKKLFDESKESRLAFTKTIEDKLISPAMEFEKRSTLLLEGAKNREFNLRKIVNDRNSASAMKQTEHANFEAHIKNEYFRIAAKYRTDLETLIFNAYKTALQQRQPLDQIEKYKQTIVTMMGEIKLDSFRRFERQIVSNEHGQALLDVNGNPVYKYTSDAEAMEIFGRVKKYDATNDLIVAKNTLENKFAMYAHDLQNADAAIAAQQNAFNSTITAIDSDAQIEQSTNKLVASAAVGTIVTSGNAKIKTKMDVVPENSEQWEMAVLNSYIKNFVDCQQFITAKERKNRKLDQFATALGKLASARNQTSIVPGAVYPGLTLMKIEK